MLNLKSEHIAVIQQIECIEAQCRAGHSALYSPDLPERKHSQTLNVAGASVEVSGVPPEARFGRVYGFGLYEPATKDALDSILDILADAKASQIRFRVPQTGQRAEIMEWLMQRGLRRSTFVVHWIAPTAPLRAVDTGYEIRRLLRSESEQYGKLIALHYHLKSPGSAAFHARLEEMPGMLCYIALDGQTVIGTGATYRDGEGCILEYGTTLRPYRKQGLQCAMIGYRLNTAADAGSKWACASTIGNDRSSRNLIRQGFRKAFDTPVYTLRPVSQR